MGHAVLSAFSPKAQAYAAKMLEERGVKIHLHSSQGSSVGSCGAFRRNRIFPRTLSFGPEVCAPPICRPSVGLRPGHGGRIDVQPDLTVPGFPEVYALGDFANISGKQGDVAAATRLGRRTGGKWCARNIAADIDGRAQKAVRLFRQGHHGHDRAQRSRGRSRPASS